jgi:four helix bundle protein
VEGCGRYGDNEFGRFLQIAIGSAYEVEYLLLLSSDLNYLTTGQYNDTNSMLKTVLKKLISLRVSLRK